VSVQQEVLEAALRICRRRGGWIFSPDEVVRALPHLKAGTVRTHVISRCCINAPKNHPHRLGYFLRVGRGRYEVASAYRVAGRARPPASSAVSGRAPAYGRSGAPILHETIHAVVRRERSGYVGECLEISVVSRAGSLDELVEDLRARVDARLQEQDVRVAGLAPSPRLLVQYEVPSGAGRTAGPSWKQNRSRVAVKGDSLSQTILEDRRRGR
jgi:hypothetical protein